MKLYEISYLINSEQSEEKRKTASEEIKALIQERGGVLGGKISQVRKVKLGHPINKQNVASLNTFDFYLKPEKIKDLESILKKRKEILRSIIVNKREFKKEAKAPRKLMKPETKPETKPREKVELKDIDKKLEEILEE